MDDSAPIERLQPCLLDRLTDDEPKNREESRSQRVVSLQRYRRGVLRDLAWLFSTSAHLPVEGAQRQFRITDFPEVARSTLNFGTRHLFGLTAPDMQSLQRELHQALLVFEPRILPHTLQVSATMDRQVVEIAVSGDLWANPVPEKLFIKTKIDIEAGAPLFADG
jgi:type VI secretion system protein ImpF